MAPASARQIDQAIPDLYKDSSLVTRAAQASRLLITSSEYLSQTVQSQADRFTQTTKPNPKPMTFTPTTHERIRKVHSFSSGAVGMSSKVVGHVANYAQSIGASLLKPSEGKRTEGRRNDGAPPGLLNKSLMAFSTIASGAEYAGKNFMSNSSSAATKVVTHRYGEEAGRVSQSIGGGAMNVALVYIDITGVSRKAIVKAVAKGMVVGKVGDGNLVVPGMDDSPPSGAVPASSSSSSTGLISPPPGVVPTLGRVPSALDKPKPKPNRRPQNWKEKEAAEGRYTDVDPMMSGGRGTPGDGADGRVPPPPPVYGSGVGEVIDETKFSGDSKDRWG